MKVKITFTDEKTGKIIMTRHCNSWLELKKMTEALTVMFG